MPVVRNNKKIKALSKIKIENTSEEWHITIQVGKVYPSTTKYIEEEMLLLSNSSHKTILENKIYGDNIPVPIKENITIKCDVSQEAPTLDDILKIHENR